MSHLIHVVDLKRELTEKGVTCPEQQYQLMVEPYARAVLRQFYLENGSELTTSFEQSVWSQLDKWNCVSPIPASSIMALVTQRINVIRAKLINQGVPGCSDDYTTFVDANGEKLDISTLPSFATLVAYLKKELGAGDE